MRREIRGSGNKAVGAQIKQLRRSRGLTGQQLGANVGMSQSKLSKIETGYYADLKLQEIDDILGALEAPNDIRLLVYREIERTQPNAVIHKPFQTDISPDHYEYALKARHIRNFTLNVVPVLFQTIPYRKAALQHFGVSGAALHRVMEDTARRQDLLWDEEHTFHFIMHQVMLYAVPEGRWDLLPVQLDRIERLMDLPNVEIGLIPFEAGLPFSDIGSFSLHDTRTLFMTSAGGRDIIIKDAGTISRYGRLFTELDQLAVYGQRTKKLLRQGPVAGRG